jgi:hypothetical protein
MYPIPSFSARALRQVAAVGALLASAAVQSQTCTPTSPSLNPSGTLAPAEQNVLGYVLNSTAFAPKVVAVNSADQFQYGEAVGPNTVVTQFNTVFPPTGTANLPRLFVADPVSIARFYDSVGPYSALQLQSVQKLYAKDLTARRNFGINVANLARDLTALRQVPTLLPQHLALFDDALTALREAYDALSDVNAPAPDPRSLYRRVAGDYLRLSNDEGVDIGGARFALSFNILAIGISNYEINRVPVPGGNNAPMATGCAGCFPFEAFEVTRWRPLSAAQVNPSGVHRANVESFLARFGVDAATLSPDQQTGLGSFTYQSNSADQLQFVSAAFKAFPGSSMRMFFGPGFPAIAANNLPRFAFDTNADAYLRSATNSALTQHRLLGFYADPANSTLRANYATNLRNLACAFQQLGQDSRLPAEAIMQVQRAQATVAIASKILLGGSLPDVLGTYQSLNENVTAIFNTLPAGSRNVLGKGTPIDILKTIDTSLVPIGVINYYLTPVLLAP